MNNSFETRIHDYVTIQSANASRATRYALESAFKYKERSTGINHLFMTYYKAYYKYNTKLYLFGKRKVFELTPEGYELVFWHDINNKTIHYHETFELMSYITGYFKRQKIEIDYINIALGTETVFELLQPTLTFTNTIQKKKLLEQIAKDIRA